MVAIRHHDSFITGIALDLAHDGGLILTTEHKQIKVLAGDVTLN
ncbi:MAG: hypothetical protein HY277_07595 [Ignavibacteriales bacterium]|nr:hypothetical protein [Ignavibacteriales bacterium]